MKSIDCTAGRTIFLPGWGSAPAPLRLQQLRHLRHLRLGARGRRADRAEDRHVLPLQLRRFPHAQAGRVSGGHGLRGGTPGAGSAPAFRRAAIEAIVGVSTVLDYFAPSNSVRVQKRLGLDSGLTFDLIGGCGVLAQGIFQAVQLLQRAGPPTPSSSSPPSRCRAISSACVGSGRCLPSAPAPRR